MGDEFIIGMEMGVKYVLWSRFFMIKAMTVKWACRSLMFSRRRTSGSFTSGNLSKILNMNKDVEMIIKDFVIELMLMKS